MSCVAKYRINIYAYSTYERLIDYCGHYTDSNGFSNPLLAEKWPYRWVSEAIHVAHFIPSC